MKLEENNEKNKITKPITHENFTERKTVMRNNSAIDRFTQDVQIHRNKTTMEAEPKRAIKDNDNPVVINYDVLYDTTDVVKHAIKKLYSKADIAVYGFKNKIQHLGVKIFPHKMAMNVWLKRQKLDGTKENRKLGKK